MCNKQCVFIESEVTFERDTQIVCECLCFCCAPPLLSLTHEWTQVLGGGATTEAGGGVLEPLALEVPTKARHKNKTASSASPSSSRLQKQEAEEAAEEQLSKSRPKGFASTKSSKKKQNKKQP